MSFLYKTKGNSLPDNKPRVFFTCHPDDFEMTFETIYQSIFKSHDCTIYYLENLTAEIQTADLQRMNLLVIPVTLKLLTQKNRTMEEFLPFALKEHIPVLPLMMEDELDSLYSNPKHFNEMQYLKPYSEDITEISFGEKLKRYLDSVLIGHETADRIRAAFDSYIFLSYRKKDRKYAQELMRLIHQRDELTGTAIWYDEFLTPGESFEENIHRMLKNSHIFTLLVTPSILEDFNHLPNYVVQHEYPAALTQQMPIVPAEMITTNKEELHQKFPNLPECSDPYDEQFTLRLIQSLKKEAVSAKDKEHNFLIGLAYLEGIDVETDTAKGLSLIKNAAQQQLPEAVKKLYSMYSQGIHVSVNYTQALQYAKQLTELYQKELGNQHPDTIQAIRVLSTAYAHTGDVQNELRSAKDVFFTLYHTVGINHKETIDALERIAEIYQNHLSLPHLACDLFQSAYAHRKETLGKAHPETISTQLHLALSYAKNNKRNLAHSIREEAYHLCCKTYESHHPVFISVIKELAKSYGDQRNHLKALELKLQVYEICTKQYGELHAFTIDILKSLSFTYRQLKRYDEVLALHQKIYHLRCDKYGEIQPSSISALTSVGFAYRLLERNQEALECYEKAHQLYLEIYEDNHPVLTDFYSTYSTFCKKIGNTEKAEELRKKANAAFQNTQTKRSKARKPFSAEAFTSDDPEQLILYYQKIAEEQSILFGEDHEETLKVLNHLAIAYSKSGNSIKALELHEKIYAVRLLELGERHPETLKTMKNLSIVYNRLGDHEQAAKMNQEIEDIENSKSSISS